MPYIFVTAALKGDVKGLRRLIKGGANPNQAINLGWTPLMSATICGHSEAVKLLLEHNADPNQANIVGDTALMFAEQNGHSEIAKVCSTTGQNRNKQTKTIRKIKMTNTRTRKTTTKKQTAVAPPSGGSPRN